MYNVSTGLSAPAVCPGLSPRKETGVRPGPSDVGRHRSDTGDRDRQGLGGAPRPGGPPAAGVPRFWDTEERVKVAMVPGKTNGVLVPLLWAGTGTGVRMAWALDEDMTREQFEREVRRLFPMANSYKFESQGGDHKAEVG